MEELSSVAWISFQKNFAIRTSHWCKHEEQQQLEEGERKLDLWRLDFRT